MGPSVVGVFISTVETLALYAVMHPIPTISAFRPTPPSIPPTTAPVEFFTAIFLYSLEQECDIEVYPSSHS